MRWFTQQHQWIEKEGEDYRIGFSCYAIKELGEIVYLDPLSKEGDAVAADSPIAEVESLKNVDYFLSPVAGYLKKWNPLFKQGNLSSLNQTPEGEGWIAILSGVSEISLDSFMKEEDYLQYQKTITG